jgi:hypothetical protein
MGCAGERWRSADAPAAPVRYGVEGAGTPLAAAAKPLPTPLFLTSRIPETEAYRSDPFEVGFGFATRNRLAVGRTWNHRESFSYPHPGAAAHH